MVTLLSVLCTAVVTAAPSTLIFVGGAHGDATSPTLAQLKARLAGVDPKHGVVVFTGNYSAHPLPLPQGEHRAEVERDLQAHVAATFDFVARGGRVYYLPGQDDFSDSGSDAVRRMRAWLNRAYAKAAGDDDDDPIDVMPGAACGDTALVELGKNVGLLLVDSQWWMQNWADDPHANVGCDLKTRAQFVNRVHSNLLDFRTRRLIIASHHPLKSYGARGGAFTTAAHLSPAPILGTALVLARQAGLVEQYQNHPMVRSYVEAVFGEAQRNGRYVFVSGHDASQQWLTLEGQTQLIAGTSSRVAEPVAQAEDGDFAAAVPGWVEMTLDAEGSGGAVFVSDPAGLPLFTHALPERVAAGVTPSAPPPPLPVGPVYARYSKAHVWQLGAVTKFFAGSFYADAYGLEQPYDVLDLEKEGLTVQSVGGGFQTNGLRLRDALGADWAIRSTTKESARLLPYPYNQLAAANRLLDHGQTASHPEAALTAARISHAASVLSPEPKLWFLPDQEALAPYRGFISNEVVLLERRASEPKEGVLPESLAGPVGPGGKTKFRSTEDMTEKLLDKPYKHHLDQEAMLRARLVDVLLADWDRHEGQWRFAGIAEADGTRRYLPIARDRDQAFAHYDGVGLWFARLASPDRRELQPFDGSYGSLEWLTNSARDLDPMLLSRLTRAQWQRIAKEVQAAITDAVIDDAFSTWHRDAFALDGARIAAALKQRRDRLPEAAEAFYRNVSHHPDVVGSRHDDVFDLWFEPAGAVRLAVRGRAAATPFFDRTFFADETSELRIYALEGDDWLYVHGRPHEAIRIRFVGGEGQDVVAAAKKTGAVLAAPAIRLSDAPGGARIDASIDVSDERSDAAFQNEYDSRENHLISTGFIFPGLYVNPDDGLFVGGTYTWVQQGYKKAPFSGRHDLTAFFATATLGVAIDYRGLFPMSVGLLDQQLDVSLRTPTYTRNFYGLTNVFVADDFDTPDFNRVRQGRAEARWGLSKTLRERTRVGLQLTGQAIVTEATPGRFVSTSPQVTPDVFGPKYYAGARLFAETNTFDSPTLPRRGVALHVSADSRYDVGLGSRLSTNYKVAAAVAVPFDRGQRFVLLTRAAVEGIIGAHAFYFAPTLGEAQLRAYHREQLAGDLAVSHSTDLRIDVWRVHSLLPGTIGVNLSFDHGRVFGEGIASNDYHVSLGGGVWWSVLDVFGVSVSYHRSPEGAQRVSLMVGPLFAQTGF